MPDNEVPVPQPDSAEAPPPPLPELTHEQLLELLDKAGDDPTFRKEARSRRWVGGIAGEVAMQQREEERQRAAREAVEAERARLKTLRTEDPLRFAEEIGERIDREEERRQLAGLREATRAELIGQMGAALRSFPEAEKLTPDHWKELEDVLRSTPEDQMVGAFSKKFTELLTEIRAEEFYQRRHQREMEDDRKAEAKASAVKAVQTRQSPSVRQPSNGNARDDAEPDWIAEPKEWAAWDKRQEKAGRGIYARAIRR